MSYNVDGKGLIQRLRNFNESALREKIPQKGGDIDPIVWELRKIIQPHKKDVNTKDGNGMGPLMHFTRKLCIREGDTPEIWYLVEGVRLLIDFGADINAPDEEGYTPLMYLRAFKRRDHVVGQILKCVLNQDGSSSFGTWEISVPVEHLGSDREVSEADCSSATYISRDQLYCVLAPQMGFDSLKIGINLGLSCDEIDTIKQDSLNNTINANIRMLSTWDRRKHSEDKLKLLAEALNTSGRKDLENMVTDAVITARTPAKRKVMFDSVSDEESYKTPKRKVKQNEKQCPAVLLKVQNRSPLKKMKERRQTSKTKKLLLNIFI